MGQEIAETQLIAALRDRDDGLSLSDVRVTGFRSAAVADRRLPLARIGRLPFSAQALIGRALYQGFDLIHRLDLRLPPARYELLTVHDVAPLRFPDEGVFPRTAAASIRSAAAVVCPSEFSAREISSQFGRTDVHVVPNGLDPIFLSARPLGAEDRTRLGLPERWALHTGGATTRKNLEALAEAWRIIAPDQHGLSLVLCGPEDPRRTELFRPLPNTHLIGRVPRELVPRLMASAAVVVVPSIYEGYGLPVLEAMAAGVPLVASNAASLPEVAGPGAILVDPTAHGLAGGITRALAGVPNETLAAARDLAASRSWAAAASAYATIYRDLLTGD